MVGDMMPISPDLQLPLLSKRQRESIKCNVLSELQINANSSSSSSIERPQLQRAELDALPLVPVARRPRLLLRRLQARHVRVPGRRVPLRGPHRLCARLRARHSVCIRRGPTLRVHSVRPRPRAEALACAHVLCPRVCARTCRPRMGSHCMLAVQACYAPV